MDVILLEDVDKVGLRGDVVAVARGYARNFLLPRRLAEEATPAKVAELRKRDEQRSRHEAQTFDQAQSLAQQLRETELRFDVQAGPTGTLFGSVTATNVADELWNAKKIRVDRRKIDLHEPIKRIGRYEIPIDLFQDVRVEVRTLVVPEGGELPPEEELEALAAAEAAEQPEAEAKHELDLDELDAAALAQEAQLTASGELQPPREDVAAELPEDEFDRAVDAGTTEEQQQP
jgi:large subunit ribosomal protein L9